MSYLRAISWSIVAPPALATWTWVNQNGATAADQASGGISLQYAGGDVGLHCLVRSAPATPYTVTALLLLTFGNDSTDDAGILFRQSGTGGIHKNAVAQNGSFSSRFWTNATTFTSVYLDMSSGTAHSRPMWLHISDNGTNRIVRYSTDGSNYNAYNSVARTTNLTADQIGFYVRGGAYAALTLLSWATS